MSGRLLYLSGQGPLRADGTLCTGKVGRDVMSRKPTSMRASPASTCWPSPMRRLGDLGRVVRVVKLLGMVNAIPTSAIIRR